MATIDGVVLYPPRFAITTGVPFSTTATHELVVPRSMPMTVSAMSLPGPRRAAYYTTLLDAGALLVGGAALLVAQQLERVLDGEEDLAELETIVAELLA